MGDACTRFNPIYGQGVSQIAMGACILDDVLRRVPDEPQVGALTQLPLWFSAKFFEKHVVKVSDPMWTNAKMIGQFCLASFPCRCELFSDIMADYGFPHTIPEKGETKSMGWFVRWYSDKIFRASTWVRSLGHGKRSLEI